MIIAHKDLDGACAAAILYHTLQRYHFKVDVIAIKGGALIKRIQQMISTGEIRSYDEIAIVDLGPRSEDIFSFLKIFKLLRLRLKYIFDHHVGWEPIIANYKKSRLLKCFNIYLNNTAILKTTSNLFCVNTKASSCGQVIQEFYGINDPYLKDLAKISMISDDLSYKANNEEIQIAYQKLHYTPTNAAIREMGDHYNINSFKYPNKSSGKYSSAIEQESKAKEVLDSKVIEISPGIGYLAPGHAHSCDITQLFREAYKKYLILIIQKNKDFFTVGHCIPGINLVELLDARAGNPRRVTLRSSKLDSIDKIVERLKWIVN